jgi:hypothetical protein
MKTIKATELTTHQRIEILEDVLRKLESGETEGGLCYKIENSAFDIFRVWDYANKIIPIFTLKNAKRVTEVKVGATEGGYWWYPFENYDFENRIKFVKWMINEEKLTNNI